MENYPGIQEHNISKQWTCSKGGRRGNAGGESEKDIWFVFFHMQDLSIIYLILCLSACNLHIYISHTKVKVLDNRKKWGEGKHE